MQRRALVVITGASSGIGLATARLFARRGWNVGLVARSEEGLALARRDVTASGAEAVTVVADVTDGAALEHAAASIEQALGPIDVWVNNAGASTVAPFLEVSEDEFRRVTEVTYMGTVNGVRTALGRMSARDRGTIVNVASAIAYRGAPLMAPYSGAKYAVRGFTEAVRSELLHDRSRVHLTMVHPPSVNTPFFAHAPSPWTDATPRPAPPVYQPEVVADAIHFAATHRRREVMVGAQTVQLVWLNKVAPGLADWLAGKVGYAAQRSTSRRAMRLRDPSLVDAGSRVHQARGPWFGFEHSAQLWVTKNRGIVALCLGLGVLGTLVTGHRRPSGRTRSSSSRR